MAAWPGQGGGCERECGSFCHGVIQLMVLAKFMHLEEKKKTLLSEIHIKVFCGNFHLFIAARFLLACV